jgi:hypothetical protein
VTCERPIPPSGDLTRGTVGREPRRGSSAYVMSGSAETLPVPALSASASRTSFRGDAPADPPTLMEHRGVRLPHTEGLMGY